MTPPPAGRKARKGYISKDDFAAVVGVTRSRMYAWTRRDHPEYPEAQYRARLAELSGGRYQPEEFGRASETAPIDRLERLEAEVARLTEASETAKKAAKALLGRVRALEKLAQARQPQSRQAETATRAAPARRGRAAR